MQVRLLSLGATVHSVIYPGEGAEEARDVVMGFDKVSKIILNMPQCPPCHIHPHSSVSKGVWLRRQGESLLLGNHRENDQQVMSGHPKYFQIQFQKTLFPVLRTLHITDVSQGDWWQGGDRWRDPPALPQRLWHQVPPPRPRRQEQFRQVGKFQKIILFSGRRKNWEVSLSESGDGAIFSLLSPHGEEVKSEIAFFYS